MSWQHGVIYQKKGKEPMLEQIEPGGRFAPLPLPFYPNLIEKIEKGNSGKCRKNYQGKLTFQKEKEKTR